MAMAERMEWRFDDGGREVAGYKGKAGDCVARSVAIASGRPYAEVYAQLAAGTGAQRAGKRGKRPTSARNGINTTRKWFKEYMAELGFEWVPTMRIGSGCRVHLAPGELPPGRLVVSVSKHMTAVIDGVIHDTHDPQRETHWIKGDGTSGVSRRCVYGYWICRDPR
jgi:hypothetical protein